MSLRKTIGLTNLTEAVKVSKGDSEVCRFRSGLDSLVEFILENRGAGEAKNYKKINLGKI